MVNSNVHFIKHIRTQIEKRSDEVVLRHQVANVWNDINWKQFGKKLDAVSLTLLSLGLKPQEKIGLYANNMPRWTIADIGALQIRAVTVPIYSTSTASQSAYIINNADIKVLFVGEQAQYDIAARIFDECEKLELIVVMCDEVDIQDNPAALHWDEFIAKGSQTYLPELNTRLDEMNLDDLFTLIYTSGTTGQPKGVMLDHRNIINQFLGHAERVKLTDKDISLCFLPLSHVYERVWTYYVFHNGATNCYLQDTMQVYRALNTVRPTVMCAVPRFYEKAFSAIHKKISDAPFHHKVIFAWAVNVGSRLSANRQKGKKSSFLLKTHYKLADKFVLSKLRALFGGNIAFMACGGAKLDVTIGKFFHAIGLNVKLGYGMTETTATISCWDDNIFDPNSVGTAMEGVEIKIGKNDEILVRGSTVMRGYYKMPEETAKAFDEQGFLKTGDAGVLDENGNIYITDRIKELMKTSGGKYIAPQVLENTFGKDHFIEQIAIIADARKFVSALIVPHFESLEDYAKKLNIQYHNSVELIKNHHIVNMFEKRIAVLQKDLAKFEQVKKFTLLPKAFSMDEGELTPTQKLRRKVIHEKYEDKIEGMYADNSEENNKK